MSAYRKMKLGHWLLAVLLVALGTAIPAAAGVVVFYEPGFPAIESQPPSREALAEALDSFEVDFMGVEMLQRPDSLEGVDLLVLPYGSAFPADAWPAIRAHLLRGGNLLNLGGRALWVPVFSDGSAGFRQDRPQGTYWRTLAPVHAAEIPRTDYSRFAWDPTFPFETEAIRVRRVFTIDTLFVANFANPEGKWRGLGFFFDDEGRKIASPVTRLDYVVTPPGRQGKGRGRFVMLPFEPEEGYWESADGRSLIREAAAHAALGSALVWLQTPLASVHEGETAQAVLHLRDYQPPVGEGSIERQVRVELRLEGQVIDSQTVPVGTHDLDTPIRFPGASAPGLYELTATYRRGGQVVDVHETGFWRRDVSVLSSGAWLGVGSTYLRRGDRPFIPIGVNMWVNDTAWPFFPSNANAFEWNRDFAEMADRGLNFVRTGIWFSRDLLIDRATRTAREEVLRNMEAMFLTAGRHGMQVQFVFFSFEPQTSMRGGSGILGPGRNPYTDPVAIESQAAFVRSIVARFKNVPFVSWDLINEPSYSNPKAIFSGNQPNNDPTEIEAWNEWLRDRYGTTGVLAELWGEIPGELRGAAIAAGMPAVDDPPIAGVPLPSPEDLGLDRRATRGQVRAFDYNLFAQDMFSHWAAELVKAIRSTGSRQMVAVGQDEGGVTDRLLNHFYGEFVDITSLHNWWQDDALLWDAFAAKRPGTPNLLGETGPQPSIALDGVTRWDEVHGLGLAERKTALGLAAGNAGAAIWIWSRTDPYRWNRSDGSSTLWIDMISGLGRFARDAEPFLGDERPGEVAMILPQTLQLSAFNAYAIEAQQKAVRALFYEARSSAYAVGEYQIDLLGKPKLILLPSPWMLNQRAWEGLLEAVREGATLLVTGRFDLDEHFRPTGRHTEAGIDYHGQILATRENHLTWPGGEGWFSFSGNKTTFIEQAVLASGDTFVQRRVGAGEILFFSLPLELSDDTELLGDVYDWALEHAGIEPIYDTELDDPGIVISPTVLDKATLYVVASESSLPQEVSFRDRRSGQEVEVELEPGRAAVVLVTREGEIPARYDSDAVVP
jgi:hypothetical protein